MRKRMQDFPVHPSCDPALPSLRIFFDSPRDNFTMRLSEALRKKASPYSRGTPCCLQEFGSTPEISDTTPDTNRPKLLKTKVKVEGASTLGTEIASKKASDSSASSLKPATAAIH